MPLIASGSQRVAQPQRQQRQQRPAQQQPSQPTQRFEQLHPRGRGGKWILKPGTGTGPEGADMTTAELQQRLQQLGFQVPVNGQYDGTTQAAVAAFQERYGLDPHGGIDAATMEVMQNPPEETLAQVQKAQGLTAQGKKISTTTKKTTKKAATKKAATGSSKASTAAKTTLSALGTGTLSPGLGTRGTPNTNVKALQTALTKAGYKVNSDGRFGPGTEAAVKKLQRAHGLKATGVVDNATKGLLGGLAAGKAGTTKTTTTKKTTAAKGTTQPRAAGGRVTVQAPVGPGEVVRLRTAAEQPERSPELEEEATLPPTPPVRPPSAPWGTDGDYSVTRAFGFGGQPSRSIKDGRTPIPAYDQPIWLRTGVRINPNLVIPDGRQPAVVGRGLTIRDGRDIKATLLKEEQMKDQSAAAAHPWYRLQEAIEARQAASGSTAFVRALARERVLRRQLEEKTFTAAKRQELADKGHALPGGGFPIENASDLQNAIKALGRATNPDAARRHIIKRARELNLVASLPDSWNVSS